MRPCVRKPCRRNTGIVVLTAMSFVAAATGAAQAKPGPAAPASKTASATITARAGAIGAYVVGNDLSCDLTSTNGVHEFYGQTGCGTIVWVDGQSFSPSSVSGGLVPVRQSTPGGTGTAADPYSITTTVAAGTTGVTIRQADTYVTGSDSITTTMSVSMGASAHQVFVTHAADCYVSGSDAGFGVTGGVVGAVQGEVGCRSRADNGLQGSTLLEFVPRTAGSSYYESGYADNWNYARGGGSLPNSCLCSSYIDNGMSLRWGIDGAVGSTTTVRMSTRLRVDLPAQSYVALGDSYSSGEGSPSSTAPRWFAGTDVDGNKCHRSPESWGVQLQEDRFASAPFGFHACSGAVTSDLTNPNHSNPREATPQLSWLNNNTGVVTITIGGNDALFGEVMGYCAKRTSASDTCQAAFQTRVDAAIATLANTNALDGSLRILYAEINEAAPNAQIFVVGYPRFFPSSPPRNCATGVPGFRFAQSDMQWINSETDKLDAAIAGAADLTPNTHYVDVSDVLSGHDICATNDLWINRAQVRNQVFSYHPNVSGQQQIAAVVEQQVAAFI